ncbi:MAG: PBP1A family penicillin-binding protein [Pseudomonadota bacterium]
MIIKKTFFSIIALVGILSGILAGAFFSLVHDLPQINSLKQFKPSAVTSVYSSDNHLLAQFYIQKRFPKPLEKIPQHLIDALLVIEDRTFFSHSGIHFKAIARAVIHDIREGRFKQGASTLTQQLAKTLFLTTEKSFTRKIKEAILTLQIERRYTKNQILELYLNLIYLGSGSYGVEAASQTYFEKSVSDLTLDQAALIAGLPKAPSTYSPIKNPDLAKKRRDIVLNQMLSAKKITREQYQTAICQKISQPALESNLNDAGYFVEYIKARLNEAFNLEKIYSAGLSVHTSLNFDFQRATQKAVAKHMAVVENRIKTWGKDVSNTQCAVIAIDTRTGNILSMVGGKDFSKSSFNRVTQARRQPGSAFKPFVYAAAVMSGFSQNDLIFDGPLSLSLDNNQTWEVKNFSNTFFGQMTLRKALALSKNTPAVRLIEQIGPDTVINLARKAGISSLLSPTLSLALGTYELTLLELTAAYIPFANMGIKTQPISILNITDADSRIIYQTSVKQTAVMSRQDAAIVTDMLKAVIFEGTGKKAGVIKKEIAGKTGTTDQFKDALFIGFSPDIALGVWVGNDDATPLGKNETGANTSLPIWIDCMQYFLENRLVQYFDIPEGTKMIYMDPDTGKTTDSKFPGSVKALIKQKG